MLDCILEREGVDFELTCERSFSPSNNLSTYGPGKNNLSADKYFVLNLYRKNSAREFYFETNEHWNNCAMIDTYGNISILIQLAPYFLVLTRVFNVLFLSNII